MDKATEVYYDNYFLLFNTDGWKQLCKELTDQAQIINSVEYTRDGDDLLTRKGQLSVIASILNLSDTITRAYEDAKEEA